jgi:hypothetical protein
VRIKFEANHVMENNNLSVLSTLLANDAAIVAAHQAKTAGLPEWAVEAARVTENNYGRSYGRGCSVEQAVDRLFPWPTYPSAVEGAGLKGGWETAEFCQARSSYYEDLNALQVERVETLKKAIVEKWRFAAMVESGPTDRKVALALTTIALARAARKATREAAEAHTVSLVARRDDAAQRIALALWNGGDLAALAEDMTAALADLTAPVSHAHRQNAAGRGNDAGAATALANAAEAAPQLIPALAELAAPLILREWQSQSSRGGGSYVLARLAGIRSNGGWPDVSALLA